MRESAVRNRMARVELAARLTQARADLARQMDKTWTPRRVVVVVLEVLLATAGVAAAVLAHQFELQVLGVPQGSVWDWLLYGSEGLMIAMVLREARRSPQTKAGSR